MQGIWNVLLGWIPEIILEGKKTNMKKTSYVVVLMMIAVPVFGGWAYFNFARAENVKKIEDAVNQMAETLNVSASLQIASQIRSVAKRRCDSSAPGERTRLNDEIDKLQAQYKKITREFYSIPVCGDL
ncbi:MAG: hypothetical protein ACRCVK_11350 [Aeromonas veronii]